jgi:hypothetical protein
MGSEGSTAKFLVRDRDTKCVTGFDEVLQSECAQILRTPFRTSNGGPRSDSQHIPTVALSLGTSGGVQPPTEDVDRGTHCDDYWGAHEDYSHDHRKILLLDSAECCKAQSW